MREQLTAYQLVYYDFGAIDERERILQAIDDYRSSRVNESYSINFTTLQLLIEGETP